MKADAALASLRKQDRELELNHGIYPLDAPQLSVPGPDFMVMAGHLGDTSEIVSTKVKLEAEGDKKGKTKTVKQLRAGAALTELMQRALRQPGFEMPVLVRAGQTKPAVFVPGHIWGQHADAYADNQNIPVDGPHRSDVMIIGKMPGRQEVSEGRCLVGETSMLFLQALRDLHFTDIQSWYVTNLCKFAPPDGSGTLKRRWIDDCIPLLQQELRIVRPKYILCLGADASKVLLGTKNNVGYMDGRVVEMSYSLDHEFKEDPEQRRTHTSLVMTVVHPASVARAPDMYRMMERGLARFKLLISGLRFDKEETDIDHREIRTLEDLEDLIYEISNDPDKVDNWISIDAEWHGEHPVNAGSYVRLIQLAWKPKHAAAIVWANAGGKTFITDQYGDDARERVVALMNEFLADKRIIGHFLVADMEWLDAVGMIAVRERFKVPLYDKPFDDFNVAERAQLAAIGYVAGDTVPAWVRTKFEGGWDTGLAAHAIEETSQLGLEVLTMRYTSCPRYDIPLQEWKTAWCKERGLKTKDLEGYGEVDDSVLVPYANYDADATMRLAFAQMPLLERDYEGNCCREPFWESMITTMPILEMHEEGMCVDRKRIDYLTEIFMESRARQQKEIQDWARWPDFNIRSVQHVKEFLFGDKLNGKRDKLGNSIRIRPDDALSLELEPVLDTSKPPKLWRDIRERGMENEHSPSTGKTILGVLASDNPGEFTQVQWVRDFRFVDQVLKSILRPPKLDTNGQPIRAEDESDDTGVSLTGAAGAIADAASAAANIITGGRDNLSGLVYEAGLASVICRDGRVRTHLYPTTETGRWRSARPNLQNMCFDAETEVLTVRGWVKAPSLLSTDSVAQFWAETGKIDFTVPETLTRFKHSGEMIEINNQQIDLLVTPDHRCLLRRRKRRGGTCFEVPASSWGGDYQHVHAGIYAGGKKTLDKNLAIFLCALQADGSFNAYGTVSFCGFSKPRKYRRLEKLLKLMQISYSKYRSEQNVTTADGSVVKKTVVGFYVHAADPINKIARKLLPDKCFGPWLLDYDRKTLDVIADEVLFWDGLWTRKSEYSSSDKPNADWVQILWTLTGRRARMREYRNSNENSRLHYCVNIRPGQPVDYSMSAGAEAVSVPWDDAVYCLTVPSSFVVVRRNGKVSITGNSKRRDDDYLRILGQDRYKQKIRSIICADPGHVLIEADFKSAELYCMAIMSGDPLLLEHCQRNQLDENDLDYYDIHSSVAVASFNLHVPAGIVPEKLCQKFGLNPGTTYSEALGGRIGDLLPANKRALQIIGKAALRVAAKNVIFGCAYGRGAKAIALQCKEEGNPVTVDDAQQIVDSIFAMYSGLVAFFEAAKARVVGARWLCSCFGRLRRFPHTNDQNMVGEFERQAMNFGIQSMVASAADRAVAYLQDYRDNVLKNPDVFRMKLQVHDAVIVSAPYRYAKYVAQHVLPYNMTNRVAIWPSDLAGIPTGTGPFHLGVDVEIFDHWGEALPKEIRLKCGLPEHKKG